ncbi:putative transcriptional regulator, contains HTHdomain [Halalkaliarchaeum sp. AArc-CO]|uniref:helix-turn-helix domain-containing protein n=1 Tax=Halalkaliarchaeum sp. AArc-CO TaxID=2866381 RepID=UPI00217F1D8B|nr:helix-turn-helix domain-containing protein [Halalkaliarchaeum sp. AArc-CO]UWG49971.1 putative transcriptional regulator, contains HTHdomain [Halalkaliarchaeum sp. AArc-CO]
MTGPEFVETSDTEAAFTALADETRIEIIRTLWAADGHEARFSELREAVGVRDSGRFNYHLEELLGQFVAKTDDGYELAEAGIWANGAIERGAYTMEGTLEPVTLEEPCRTCGEPRTLYYEGETVRIECESCPVKSEFTVPPSVFVDVDREQVPDTAGRYLRSMFQHLGNGFCWYCDGRIRRRVGPAADPDEEIPEDASVELFEQLLEFPLVEYDCRRCGATSSTGIGHALLDHPAVVGLFNEHDVGVDGRSVWRFAALDTDRARILERDPFRAAVTYEAETESLTLTVDGNCDVLEIDDSDA